ncbi:hypothetical protein [Thiothrix lacustris]|uniref:Nucleotidyltransferase n=1 Tax=Thiothrix lacustris TaxID=525917 RepID=A0ABY9MVK5_9GAMM|nr:hypothetical protein [Thiothrix lacustris]WML91445.1 hypothetical protein RCF98_03600 [Thiothrix lacustris]WMP16702.1 hypothetical protein RCS87_15145 [Thiothrix lacustris]
MRTSRDELRHLVADEAARLIYDDGMRDYRLAKLRAAENLGVRMQGSAQPTNEEVEEAIHQRIQLFDADTHPSLLRHHREVALEAMDFLQAYRPYLTGAALEGTSSPHSAVTLYLGADSVEEVMFFLEDQHIPFQIHERRTRLGSKKQDYFPLLRFYVDDVEVELMVFPQDDRFAGAPISPITGKAMKRADRKKVAVLLG